MEFPEGTEIDGRYVIQRKLGAGGMGAVYVAADQRFGGFPVALKVAAAVGPMRQEIARRFEREAFIGRVLGKSRGFVPATDRGNFGEGGMFLYLVLDLVENATPLDVTTGSLDERLARIQEAAEIVARAHDKRVLHRDLKPENFLQAADGELMLTDFGLAKLQGHPDHVEGDSGLTQTHTAMGTPRYMAPEQFQDAKHVDARADVFALGVMLYQALTGGRVPFDGESLFDYVHLHARILDGRAAFPRARDVAHTLDPRLDALCAKTMSLERDQRTASAAELAQSLQELRPLLAPSASGPSPAPLACTGSSTSMASTHDPSQAPDPGTLPPPSHVAPTKTKRKPLPRRRATAASRAAAKAAAPIDNKVDETHAPSVHLPAGVQPAEVPGTFRNPKDGSALVWLGPGTFTMGRDDGDPKEAPAHTVERTRGVFLSQAPVTWGQLRQWVDATGAEVTVDGDDDAPAAGLRRDQAEAYCAWAAGRLPTEAEWEHAARTLEGFETHHPEWVRDGYAKYDATPQTDPEVPAKVMFLVREGPTARRPVAKGPLERKVGAGFRVCHADP